MKVFIIPALTGVLLSLLACSSTGNKDSKDNSEAHLGVVNLEVSGSPEAQKAFEEGLLLLHSFEYEDAAHAFQSAQQLDSTFAMAYWGEAMTCNHPLWDQQDFDEAREILDRLSSEPAARLALAQNELEKDFLKAVEILYGEGEKVQRDSAYAVFMGNLHEEYPDNHEVAAFYALSLLGSVPVGRDDEIYGQGAAVAQSIIKENPQHPGALHYLIHSYDDPYHAAQAITAANNYAKVAPDAAHALHMPSHIFVAMGMWEEVVASNEASWAASVSRMKRMDLDNSAQSYHALHWLLYGYLQQGRHADALTLVENMVGYIDTLPSKGARMYMLDMQATYGVATGEWEQKVLSYKVDMENLDIVSTSQLAFIEGMQALGQGNGAALAMLLRDMENERKKADLLAVSAKIPVCNAPNTGANAPNKLEIAYAHVMELELKALQAEANGESGLAEELLIAAIELEESSSYSYGPPVVVKPSSELYAEWLLQANRPQEAYTQFENTLDRAPLRLLSLQGKRQAALALNKSEEVKELDEILKGMIKPSNRQTALAD